MATTTCLTDPRNPLHVPNTATEAPWQRAAHPHRQQPAADPCRRRLNPVTVGFWLGGFVLGTGGAIFGACMPYRHPVAVTTFQDEPSLVAWLERMTLSAARSHQTTTPLECAGPAAGRDCELWQRIEVATTTLPVPYREIFLLSDVERMSNGEVAQRLGLNVPAVRRQLHQARLLLRQVLGEAAR